MLKLVVCALLLTVAVNEVTAISSIATAILQELEQIFDSIASNVFAVLTSTYGYTLNTADSTCPKIKPKTKYPLQEIILQGQLKQLLCKPIGLGIVLAKLYANCGNGWCYDGTWCFCQGTVTGVSTTTAIPTTTTTTPTTTSTTTTPKPTTTTTTPKPTTPTTTTKATTAPGAAAPTTAAPTTTTTPAATTPTTTTAASNFAPSVTSCTPKNGSNVTYVGRQSFTVTCTVTAKPQPASVTATVGSYVIPLNTSSTGSNVYVYTSPVIVMDTTYQGLWTVTAKNSVGSAGPATFTVNTNAIAFNISNGPYQSYKNFPLGANGTVAFQVNTCDNMFLSWTPTPYDENDAQNIPYVGLNFDLALIAYYNGEYEGEFDEMYANQANYTPSVYPTYCPTVRTSTATPSTWIMLQMNQTGTDLYYVIWSSPPDVYYSQYDNASKAEWFHIPGVTYNVTQIAFDVIEAASDVEFIYYPCAV